jgi:hypothetical protein
MNRIILNSEIINDLIRNDNLHFQTKFQRGDGKNYFFTQTISLCLYNAKVTWIDSSKKNMSFCFNKYDNLKLFIMLRHINQKLIDLYNNKIYNPVSNISTFFYEKDDCFYIKCYLPNVKNKSNVYLIKDIFNSREEPFRIPKIGLTYSSIILDIRNIWEKDNKAGFNLELKETMIDTK